MLNKTPIITPTGYKFAVDLREGDQVLSGQGIIGKVASVNHVEANPYYVSFSDGRNIVVTVDQDLPVMTACNTAITITAKELLEKGVTSEHNEYIFHTPLALGSRYSFDTNGVKRQLKLFDTLKNRGQIVSVKDPIIGKSYIGIHYKFLSGTKRSRLAIQARSLGYVVEEDMKSSFGFYTMTIYGSRRELAMLILNDKHKLKGFTINDAQKPVWITDILTVDKPEKMTTITVDTSDNCFLAGNYTILGSKGVQE